MVLGDAFLSASKYVKNSRANRSGGFVAAALFVFLFRP
jgi:hypothetical protein